MEHLNTRKAPVAVVGVVSLLLLAQGCGRNEGHAGAESPKQTPSVPAAATVVPSAAAATCRYDASVNFGGWQGPDGYGSIVPDIAHKLRLNAGDAKTAIVKCDSHVPNQDILAHKRITVEGAGTCALIAEVVMDPSISPGNFTTVVCWPPIPQ